jgi:hypothetical protein
VPCRNDGRSAGGAALIVPGVWCGQGAGAA